MDLFAFLELWAMLNQACTKGTLIPSFLDVGYVYRRDCTEEMSVTII